MEPLTTASMIGILAILTIRLTLTISKRIKRSRCTGKNRSMDIQFGNNSSNSDSSNSGKHKKK